MSAFTVVEGQVAVRDFGTSTVSMVNSLGAFRTSDSQKLVGGSFEGSSIDTQLWTETESTGGAVNFTSTGYASFESGLLSGAVARTESIEDAEFFSGTNNLFNSTMRLADTGIVNNSRRWGVFDASNGLFFELSNTTLRIVSRKSTVDTAVTVFNGHYGTSYTLDTNFHNWEILYSDKDAYFFIDRVLLHKLTATTTSYVAETSLNNRHENVNAGVTGSSAIMQVTGTSVSRLGHIPGSSGNPLNVYISGASSAALQQLTHGRISTGAGTIVRVMDTTYTQPASAVQRSVASSSASDTAAGTGAISVRITYFDGSMNGPFTEIVILAGAVAVNTVATNMRFIEKLEVVTVGTGGANAGTITLFGAIGGGGGTVGTIAIGSNKTFWAHHYVETGKTMFLRSFYCGTRGGGTGGTFHGRSTNPLLANDVEIQVTDDLRAASSTASIQRAYDTPVRIIGPARFSIFVDPDSASSTDWFASFDSVEE
jgi:hypothetical protein